MFRIHRFALAKSFHLRFFSPSAAALIEEPAIEAAPLTYLEGLPKPGPVETILAIPRSTSGKSIAAKDRKAGRVPSILFEQEDGQHGGFLKLEVRPEFESDEIIEEVRVLPRLIHLHSITDIPINVTFIRAPSTALLKVDVPLVFTGEDVSPGLRKEQVPVEGFDPDQYQGCHEMPRSQVVNQETVRMEELEEKVRNWQETAERKLDLKMEKMEQKLDDMGKKIMDEMKKMMCGFFNERNKEVEVNSEHEGQGSSYLNIIKRTVKFLCPADIIPPYIEVDLSELDVGQKLVMGDLKVHPALQLIQSEEQPVVKIMGARVSDQRKSK
ncbi:hypothetical protein GH714_004698 [Hevea brasiliensis]|uniref:Large ribosomal subunit protein bL25 beta domain-containing protein n=1 Tax=Hevea brasiliensis TaxID=3981 RepID=A0A6A6L8V9_HEVBR|nr:hypothetical protein GH714_004698 [Hevea brasiliensis]